MVGGGGCWSLKKSDTVRCIIRQDDHRTVIFAILEMPRCAEPELGRRCETGCGSIVDVSDETRLKQSGLGAQIRVLVDRVLRAGLESRLRRSEGCGVF